jgi:hypothetical protein
MTLRLSPVRVIKLDTLTIGDYDQMLDFRPVGHTDTLIDLNRPGVRVRLTARLIILEARRQSAKKHAGVWYRVAKFNRPSDSEGWDRIAGDIAGVLASLSTQPASWDGSVRRPWLRGYHLQR